MARRDSQPPQRYRGKAFGIEQTELEIRKQE